MPDVLLSPRHLGTFMAVPKLLESFTSTQGLVPATRDPWCISAPRLWLPLCKVMLKWMLEMSK